MINNRYPLYLERGGDLPYMLETGLLEEMKPSDDEERPVAEYLDEVCEAVFVALSERAA